MTALYELRLMVREILTDESVWPDSQLNAWINAGIRDYSVYFPLRAEADIACVDDTVEYSLAAYTGIVDILLVEYPKSEDPPSYLERRPLTGNFVDLPVYDILGDPPQVLVLGETPSTGETITLDYRLLHTLMAADSDVLTVPDYHLEAIRLFTQWTAIKELEITEAEDPTSTSHLTMFGINSIRAERLYRGKIDEYLEKSAPGGYAGPWVMDGFDRVY